MIPYPPPAPGQGPPRTQEQARAIIHRAYKEVSYRTNSVELRLDALADVLLSYIPSEQDAEDFEASYDSGYADAEKQYQYEISSLDIKLRAAKDEIILLEGQRL